MKINFYLQGHNILQSVSYNGKRARFTFGLTCPPKNWNKNKQRLKSSSLDSMPLNRSIDEIEKHTKDAYYDFRHKNKIPTPSEFQEEILLRYNEINEGELEFVAFFNSYIEKSKNTKKQVTINDYKATLKSILEYFDKSNLKPSWDRINTAFYEGYMDFQYNHKGNSPNLFGKRIKCLKSVLKNASSLGYNIPNEYQTFKVPTTETDHIALSEEEVNEIFNLKLDNKMLNEVRDLFIIGCRTGLRFSDFTRIEKENILENSIKIRAKKTNEIVETILHPQTKEILNKYNFKLPVVSSHNFNINIKKVCELANINETITTEVYKGNIKTSLKKVKFEMVSAHTARRTFATILYLKKVPAKFIMSVTGHKKESTFLKYIKIKDQEVIEYLNGLFEEN